MLKRWLRRIQSEHSVANPQGQNATDATIYQQLGGEKAVRHMAQRFYAIMDADPGVSELRAIHPESLEGSEQKFFEFLSGWFDGPQLYVEKYGHPMLRARHLPFSIDTRMRDQWLHCIYTTLDEQVPAGPLHNEIRQRFTRLAHHMINQPSP
ncbi:group II truncated hemoglobin [Aliidiomarina halalkaliphila]|uniref:Group II truncated hemoglobin n=1 Tax=Aliidiomarina halalkaliphila TaxID=2593535 RepID=A0A552X1C3_9GAMM|nr:group II truncated hemoglobin [Aliidiomarina halalkaliphila]TRW48775.1 group II truncated hemoglobin [Aliidiomarina halalkaliphila]